jgi:hypothetical protein
MTIHPEAERRLLEEGAESYVPAVSAILAFRDLVQSRCRRVVEHHLENYSAALGVPLDKSQGLPKKHPPTSRWDGQWANLSWQIRDVGNLKAALFHQLYWEVEEDGHWYTEVNAGIWLQNRTQVNRLWEAFVPHPQNMDWSEVDKLIW